MNNNEDMSQQAECDDDYSFHHDGIAWHAKNRTGKVFFECRSCWLTPKTRTQNSSTSSSSGSAKH
eukprot:scaffold131595_cov53-Attheya_sp.AAC.4